MELGLGLGLVELCRDFDLGTRVLGLESLSTYNDLVRTWTLAILGIDSGIWTFSTETWTCICWTALGFGLWEGLGSLTTCTNFVETCTLVGTVGTRHFGIRNLDFRDLDLRIEL